MSVTPISRSRSQCCTLNSLLRSHLAPGKQAARQALVLRALLERCGHVAVNLARLRHAATSVEQHSAALRLTLTLPLTLNLPFFLPNADFDEVDGRTRVHAPSFGGVWCRVPLHRGVSLVNRVEVEGNAVTRRITNKSGSRHACRVRYHWAECTSLHE